MLISWYRANGLGKVLRNDILDIPRRPNEAINRVFGVEGWDPPQPEDRREIDEFERKNEKWEAMCEKVLFVYKRALSSGVKEFLRGTNVDMDLATRANIFLIIETTRLRYGGYSAEKAELNFFAMKTIPIFQFVTTASMGLK